MSYIITIEVTKQFRTFLKSITDNINDSGEIVTKLKKKENSFRRNKADYEIEFYCMIWADKSVSLPVNKLSDLVYRFCKEYGIHSVAIH